MHSVSGAVHAKFACLGPHLDKFCFVLVAL